MEIKTLFSLTPIMATLLVFLVGAFDPMIALACTPVVLGLMAFCFVMLFKLHREDNKLDEMRKDLDNVKNRVEGLFLRKL